MKRRTFSFGSYLGPRRSAGSIEFHAKRPSVTDVRHTRAAGHATRRRSSRETLIGFASSPPGAAALVARGRGRLIAGVTGAINGADVLTSSTVINGVEGVFAIHSLQGDK